MTATADDELLCHISADEIEKIDKKSFKKIQDAWSMKGKEVDQLKIEVERHKADCDHQAFNLEKEIVSLRDQLESEGRAKAEAEIKCKKNKEALDILAHENEKLLTRNSSLTKDLEQKNIDHSDASEQSASLAGSLQARNTIIDQLKNEIASLEEKLTITIKTKSEAVIEAEEASSLKIQFEYREKRLEKEREMLVRQNELLQQQLHQRTEESLQIRNDHSISVLNLQTDLNHKIHEAKSLFESNQSLERQLQEKNRRVDELLEALNAERNSVANTEETFRLQLTSEKKLAELYKASTEEQNDNILELEKAVEELRRLLQEASEQYGCLEAAKKKAEEEYLEKLESSNAHNVALKQELDKVNSLLEANSNKDPNGIAELSPAAAAVSRLVSKGLTLTQLYSEYLTTSEKLLESEEEVKRLNRYVNQVVQEIEERGPAILKQREDYEKALDTINSLHGQMDETLSELESQRINALEGQRKVDYLNRENARLVTQVKDLSHQVTVLLLQAEGSRTGGNRNSTLTSPVSNGASANEFISSRLVTFRSISELQEQNTKLLSNLRELTEKLEEAEKVAVEKQTKELQDELNQSQAELNEIRANKERQQTLIDDMTRQRDMYKSLVQQQSPNKSQKESTKIITSPSFKDSQPGNDKLQSQYESALKEIALLKTTHDEYVAEKAKNDKLAHEEMERLRKTSSHATNDNIKLLSQAEYNEERIKTAQASNQTLQRQLNAIQENNTTLQGIVGRHESSIDTLRTEVFTLTKKLSQSEVMTANLREERTLLKETNARLVSDRENAAKNQTSTAMVLSNLEAIKLNLDRTDSETKMRFENKIADLTRKLVQAQTKLDSNIDLKKLEDQIQTLQEKELLAKEQYNTCKQQLESTKLELDNIKKDNEELQKQSKIPLTSPVGRGRVRGLVRAGVGASPTGVVRDLQVQLSEEKAKVSSLTKNLEETKKQCDQMVTLNDQYEKQVKSGTEASIIMQQKLDQYEKKVLEIEEELETQKQLVLDTKKANLNAHDDLKNQLIKIKSEYEAAKAEIEEIRYKLDEATAECIQAKRESADCKSSAAAAQDKYEREVMLHGADLQALSALKEKLSSHTSDYEVINSAKLKAEEALRETRLGFEERENLLKQESKELTTRAQELEDQNKNLLDQFTQLSDKMANIQNKMTSGSGDKLNVSFSEDEARSSDQLREVIKYLRRERDLAIAKSEAAQSDSARLTAQKSSLELQVAHLNTTLSEEREKAQVSLDTAGKYGEMLRKVQTMDALGDSNRLLREENEKLQNTVSEKHAQLTSIEKQIGPLQKQLRENNRKLDTVTIEKKSMEGEKDMYKRRTNELVEKLNKAKPEDMLRLQKEVQSQKKAIKIKEEELSRSKNHVAQLQEHHTTALNNKTQLQTQLLNVQKQLATVMEESKKLTEDNRKTTVEKRRFVTLINELKQKESNVRKELETEKKDGSSKDEKIKKLEGQVKEIAEKDVTIAQLRKIAKKYRAAMIENTGVDGQGDDSNSASSHLEKIKELGDVKSKLSREIVELNTQIEDLKTEVETNKEIAAARDAEITKLKTQGVPESARNDVEMKLEELAVCKSRMSLLHQTLDKTNKKVDEYESKIQLLESRIQQVEKDKEQLNKDLDAVRKSQPLSKQTTGLSKPSTSAVSIEKSSSEIPPTANVKPMAAPVATVSSPRTQAATQIVAPSRTIPTASIRPLAPSASGQPQAGSSVVLVSPLDSLSEGMVSSTVTLPQATVTPTPATPTPTQPTPSTTTLTATVSPTPATLSIPAVTAFPHQSSIATTLPVTGSTQATTGSAPPLSAQPSTSAQVASVSPSTQMGSSFVSVQQPSTAVATVNPHQEQKQEHDLLSADALVSQVIAMVTPRVDQSQSSSEDVSDGSQPSGSQPSGSHKRKLDQPEDEESKRSRVQAVYQEEVVGPSSSQQDHSSASKSNVDVVYVESEDESENLDEEAMEDKEAESEETSNFHRNKQSQGSEAEANAGEVMEVIQADEAPSESSESISQSQQPQSSSALPPGLLRPPIRSPLRRPQVSTQLMEQQEVGGDDSLVPSTPTISMPDASPSPSYVTTNRFVFVPCNSEITEGGSIDGTRLDIGHLDHASSSYLSSEAGVSTSGSPGMSGARGSSDISSISNSPRPGHDDGKFTEADSVASEVGEDSNDDNLDERSETTHDIDDTEEEGDQEEEEEPEEEMEEEPTEDDEENVPQVPAASLSSDASVASSSSVGRRRTPIKWEDSDTTPAQSISGRQIMTRGRQISRGGMAKRSRPHMDR